MRPSLSWQLIKDRFPSFAQELLAEYRRRGGFVPYDPGYVYLIHAEGSDFFKIGKSINPDKRLLQIAPKMPFGTRFVKIWRTNFMSMAETMLHEKYKSQRANGEWFQLSEFDLWNLLSVTPDCSIVNAYGIKIVRLLQKNEAECSRFFHLFDDALDPEFAEEIIIAAIEHIFRGISEELESPIPSDIQAVVDRVKGLSFGEQVEGLMQR